MEKKGGFKVWNKDTMSCGMVACKVGNDGVCARKHLLEQQSGFLDAELFADFTLRCTNGDCKKFSAEQLRAIANNAWLNRKIEG